VREGVSGAPLPYFSRPIDGTPVHTAELPLTPQRDRSIPARAWVEAPAALLHLGDDIGGPEARYLRRIQGWLLWRAGPATHADARYVAIDAADPSRRHTFRLYPDGTGEGTGPTGTPHDRFRTWKEDLRDNA
jgi:hypothetical protein